jgi:RNA polymerase sigma factor for flagellar operon FliA
MSKLESMLKRDPSEEELARELRTNVKDIRAHIEAAATRSIVALDELPPVGEDEDSISLLETLSNEEADQPGAAIEALETKESLLNVIATLGKRERLLIALYYFEGFTLTRIGEIFGVTVSRASQIHSKALLELQMRLSEVLPAPNTHGVRALGA